MSELSLGQWCLPALLSTRPEQPLLDWNFERRAPHLQNLNQSLSSISLPARFIGRRVELRQYSQHLQRSGRLLITGPGGQGNRPGG